MTQNRKNAITLGIFYIIAAVSSVIAVILYNPIMTEQWHLAVSDGFRNKILWGVINDLLLLLTAVGTAVMLYPYIRHLGRHKALAYFTFRFMEAVFIGIGLLSILVLVYLSDAYAAVNLNDADGLKGLGTAFQGIHRWVMILGPNFMLGVNTLLYSTLLSRSGLVPKLLAQFGMLAAISVFISGLLDMFSIIEPWSALKGLISLPVGVFEISLAFYLIIKGFRKEGLVKAGSQIDLDEG